VSGHGQSGQATTEGAHVGDVAAAAGARGSFDPFDARFPRRAAGLLADFARSGVLSAADVHVARRLQQLAGERDERVALAVALAVRAPRLGSVCVDLQRIRGTVAVEHDLPLDLEKLPWPEPPSWIACVAASPLLAEPASKDADKGEGPPLRLEGSRLYLDRYWQLERALAADVSTRARLAAEVDGPLLAAGLARLFPAQQAERQCQAAATALLRRFSVLAGGPGTGKTTTVARIVTLVYEQAGSAPPLVALAAPTGRAAARLEEAVHEEASRLDVAPAVREQLLALRASTLHRLLGSRAGNRSRFRHNRSQRLPHDMVIVDECSMVSLALMARLLEAVRPQARVVLVGDPDQLASVEAGAVLGDIAGPAAGRMLLSAAARARLALVTGRPIGGPDASARATRNGADARARPTRTGGDARARATRDADPTGDGEAPCAPRSDASLADGIITLERVHRFGPQIAELAAAIRDGEEAKAISLLRRHPAAPAAAAPRRDEERETACGAACEAPGAEPRAADARGERVAWIAADPADQEAAALAPLRQRALAAAAGVVQAARAGNPAAAMRALRSFRLLCAHRRGPYGVSRWTALIESWLGPQLQGAPIDGEWYPGRPLLVVENDYELGLFNGDLGVVVADENGDLLAVFERRGELQRFGRSRLGPIETAHALTVHKSQGSQFDAVAVVLPDPASPLLTRELLYTAVTRAQREVLVVGAEASVRRAVSRPIARATGLRDRLWGASRG
jgi:exodeoxyribonuclease V alpha subunit